MYFEKKSAALFFMASFAFGLLFFNLGPSAANAQTQVEYEVKTVCAKYLGTGKSYRVEAQIMKGRELNRRTKSYDFEAYSKYVVIFWSEENVSIIKLDFSSGPSAYPSPGTDQRGYKWEVSTSSVCY
ncbi:MAG: hypothetical protein ACOVN5_13975 [Aquidulcibacter sp.]|jgi:hypothetical protein